MVMSKASLKRVNDNIESIEEGFNKVLAEHGIKGLHLSDFSLVAKKTPENVSTSLVDSGGCFKKVCKPEGTKIVCKEVWFPNC